MLKAEIRFKKLVIKTLREALEKLEKTDDADEMWKILGTMSDTIVDNMD